MGTTDGRVYVFKELNDWKEKEAPPRLTRVQGMLRWPLHDCISEISEIKFSPDSSTLAVASHDQFVDLYDAQVTGGTRVTYVTTASPLPRRPRMSRVSRVSRYAEKVPSSTTRRRRADRTASRPTCTSSCAAVRGTRRRFRTSIGLSTLD